MLMKKIRKKRKFLTLAILLFLIAGCQKDEPVPDIYRLSDVIVKGANNEHTGAYAIVNGESVNGMVPFDGSSSMSYKVQLLFPPEIGDVQVTPASPGVFDFTNPVSFRATFSNGSIKNYTITLVKDTLDLPVITSFSIPWVTPEMTAINTVDKEIYARMAENTTVDNITPSIKFNKPTVVQTFPMTGAVDFSKGPVNYMLMNGNQTASYKAYIRSYGYGKLTHVSKFTIQNNSYRLQKLTNLERAAALDNTGNYIYVANGSVIQRFGATSSNTQTPGSVNLKIGSATIDATSHVENVCPLVNGTIDSKFYACNKIQNGGVFRIYNWTSYSASPKLIAEVDLTAKGATVDCFTWRYVNDRVYVYLVDVAPLYKTTPENPKVYILKDLTPNNYITSYEEKTITGVINTGFTPGPHTELTNIDGTEEFILNNGLSSPLLISSGMSVSKVFPETPRLPKTISGIRTFQYKRGKYMSYVEYSRTNTQEPSSYLNVIDMTASGFSATINTIINEGASEATLKYLTQIRIPLGNVANTELFAKTSFNPVGEKMRILTSVAGNGIYMIEWE
jgi:hypothetical protein